MRKTSAGSLTMAGMLLAAAGITLYAAMSRPEPTVNASNGTAVCPVQSDCSSSCMPVGPVAAANSEKTGKKADCGDPSQCPSGACPIQGDDTQ